MPDTYKGINMMKRYKYLSILPIALAVMMTSCTEKDNDETNNPNSDTRRIEKTTYISYKDNGDYTSGSKRVNTFEWNDNKLVKRDDNSGWLRVFNYTGDNLSEILQIDNYNNKVYTRTVFTYTGNRISEYDRYDSNRPLDENVDVYHTKFIVNYNDNGEISTVTGTGDDGTVLSFHLTWQNGNMTQYVYQYEGESTGWTSTTTYTYDNKVSWRSGMEVMAFASNFYPPLWKEKNNPLTESCHILYNDGTESNSTTTYNYTYDGEYVQSYSTGSSSRTYFKYTNTSDPAPTIYHVTARGVYGQGSVEGGGDYVNGKTVKLLATPNEGYHFTGWSNGSISNPLTFTVTSDVEYQATFEAD